MGGGLSRSPPNQCGDGGFDGRGTKRSNFFSKLLGVRSTSLAILNDATLRQVLTAPFLKLNATRKPGQHRELQRRILPLVLVPWGRIALSCIRLWRRLSAGLDAGKR